MSDDFFMQGTGDEFLELELGPFGSLIIADDGDPDPYTRTFVRRHDGEEVGLGQFLHDLRASHGDGAVLSLFDHALDKARSPRRRRRQPMQGHGPFVCDECHLTWPRKYDKYPGESFSLCPDCFEKGVWP